MTTTYYSDNVTTTFIQSANTSVDAISITGTGNHGISVRGLNTKIYATAAGGGITFSAVSAVWTTTLYSPIEILAVSGPIRWLNSDATDGIYTNGSQVTLGSKAGVTGLTTSSSDVSVFLKKLFATPAMAIGTSGVVKVQGVDGTASFGQALSISQFGLNANGQTMGGLVFGNEANTQTLTMNQALTAAGPISVYGGNITVNGNLNTSAGGTAGDVLLKASGNLALSAGKSITTNAGDVVLWSNSDGQTTHGSLLLRDGSSISTSGGHVWLGGGSGTTTWNGLSVGDGHAVSGLEITPIFGSVFKSGLLFENTSIQSGGGDVAMYGRASISNERGLTSVGTLNVNAGSGKVVVEGIAITAGRAGIVGHAAGQVLPELSVVSIESSNPDADAIQMTFDASQANNMGLAVSGTMNVAATGGGGGDDAYALSAISGATRASRYEGELLFGPAGG